MLFDSRREEVTRGWRQMQNEEPRNSYRSPSTVQKIGSVRMRWEEGNAYIDWVRKCERRRPLGRHRRAWENNIKADLK